MPLGEYLTGALFFVATLGASLIAAWLVVRKRYRYLPPLQRSLALMVVATAAIVFAHLAPAALAVLSRPTALLASLLALGGAALLRPSRAEGVEHSEAAVEQDPELVSGSRWSALIAAAAVGIVAVFTLARLRGLLTEPITDIDMLGFHLPGVARFIQTASVWRVDQFLPGFDTAQYPNNGDFLLLAAVLPWRSLAFVRLVALPYLLFTGVGAYALALELRATRAAAATLAAAVLTVPALSLLALDGLPDAVALATFATGLVFALRQVRSGRACELVLSGLAFGLSFGTKWYGTTSVVVVVVVWVAASLIACRGPSRVLREGLTLVGMVLVGGGFWLVRNLVESGNPIYPQSVSVLGLHLFAGSHRDVIDTYGYTVADYLGHPGVLRTYIYPGFKARVGFTGIVLVMGLLIAAGVAIRQLRARTAGRVAPALVLALSVLVVGLCAEYTITPGSAYGPKNMPVQTFVNIRWLMPAILVAAALSARAVRALGRAGPLLELAGLAGALDGIHLVGGTSAQTVAAVAAVLAGSGALLWLGPSRTGGRRLTRGGALAGGALAAVVLVTLGRLDQRSFDRHGYARYDPSFAFIERQAPSHHRIGIAGAWSDQGLSPTLPAFGPRLGNQVAYIGDPVAHSLHLPASESSFRSELRRGRYELLVIGLQDPAHTDVWARAAGYRLITASARLALYTAPAAGS